MHFVTTKLFRSLLSLSLALVLLLSFLPPVTVGANEHTLELTRADIQAKLLDLLYGKDEGGVVSCDFDGYVALRPFRHEGIDFANVGGHDVCALIDGVVTNAGGDKLNTIAIYDEEHDKTVIYLHTASAKVGLKVGDEVKAGQVIAKESDTGAPGAVHTHVEVRDGKQTKASVSRDYVLDNEDPYAYWELVLFTEQAPNARQDNTLPGVKKASK